MILVWKLIYRVKIKLQDLGYLNGEKYLKKRAAYAKKKADFDDKSTFGDVVTEVSKGALDNKDTDVKAGDKNDGKLLWVSWFF